MQKLVNDIHGLDRRYPELRYKAYAACVKRARCLGRPDSSCDSKKPPGNFVPVR